MSPNDVVRREVGTEFQRAHVPAERQARWRAARVGPVPFQGSDHPRQVLRRAAIDDVEVQRRPQGAVHGCGKPADDDELHPFIEQPTPAGYGHALFCAREFVGGEPFLHMVGDHLYLSRGAQRCAQ